MISLEDQQKASSMRMSFFESMPEDLQELSRKYGGAVDQMYAVGWGKAMIIAGLKKRGLCE